MDEVTVQTDRKASFGLAGLLLGAALALGPQACRERQQPLRPEVTGWPRDAMEAHRLVQASPGPQADLLHSLAEGLVTGTYGEACGAIRWRGKSLGKDWDLRLQEDTPCSLEHGECCRAAVLSHQAAGGRMGERALPIHPFLDSGRATLASFGSFHEPRFLDLPRGLKAVFRDLKSDSDGGKPPPSIGTSSPGMGSWLVPVRVTAEALRPAVPELFEHPWWIVSESTVVRTELSAAYLLVRVMDGPYQIELEFQTVVSSPVYVAQAPSPAGLAELLPLGSDARAAPFARTSALITVPFGGSGSQYVGTVRNTHGRFDMIWDSKAHSLVSLVLRTGYGDRGFPLLLDRSHLLRYEGRLFLLRSSDHYCEFIGLSDEGSQNVVLADRRYWRPERDTPITFFPAKTGKDLPVSPAR